MNSQPPPSDQQPNSSAGSITSTRNQSYRKFVLSANTISPLATTEETPQRHHLQYGAARAPDLQQYQRNVQPAPPVLAFDSREQIECNDNDTIGPSQQSTDYLADYSVGNSAGNSAGHSSDHSAGHSAGKVTAYDGTFNANTDFQSPNNCTHPAHDCMKDQPSMDELPTSYYEKQLSKFRDNFINSGNDVSMLSAKLSEIFLNRIKDIDAEASGNIDLKLVTYQEWVDMLLKMNETIVNNIENLETEVAEHLEIIEHQANQINGSCCNAELEKARRDIKSLLAVIKNGYHYDIWDLTGYKFETLNLSQILSSNDQQNSACEGLNNYRQISQDSDVMQRNKYLEHIKALTSEIASRYDENRELRNQIFCLEDEIQKAQMKIQLKDDVIKELRNDLKFNLNNNFFNKSKDLTAFEFMDPVCNEVSDTPPKSPQTATPRAVVDLGAANVESECVSPDETLVGDLDATLTEKTDESTFQELEFVLNSIFCDAKNTKNSHFEENCNRLTQFINKTISEKQEAFGRLNYIRHQLIDLETSTNEKNYSKFMENCGYLSSDINNDMQVIDTLRRRILKLNDSLFSLNKMKHNMDIKINELECNLKTEKEFSNRTSDVLREIADLLCDLTGKLINYNHLYDKIQPKNAFCVAIQELEQIKSQREQKLVESLAKSEKQVQELQLLLKCVQDEHFQPKKPELNSKDNNARAISHEIPNTSVAAYFPKSKSTEENYITTATAKLTAPTSCGFKAQESFFAKTD